MLSRNKLYLHLLDYQIPVTRLFERVRHLSYPVFLDSNADSSDRGRFDIITADPVETITAQADNTIVTTPGGQQSFDDCPFAVLKARLARYPELERCAVELPFSGGAIGFFGYDLGRRLEKLPSLAINDIGLPLMEFGIYTWAIVRDNQRKRCYFVARPECTDDQRSEILRLSSSAAPLTSLPDFQLRSRFVSNHSREQYREKYHRIIDYIRAGDCYQVNLAQRFEAGYSGDNWQAYKALRGMTDAPFSAYLGFGDYGVLSLSPERFVSVNQGAVETRPIKGTRPRHPDPNIDRQNEQLLLNSSKDKAENLMIVDLLRNDLGKNCTLGSIQVPSLFSIEAYSNVFHLVSTVTGELADGKDSLDLLRDCFPGGSITGTPKLRAMQIIEELEPHRRSAYCGSVAYINFNGDMDSSIAIRSLVCRDQRMYCWGGGGIVADSDMDEEYRESYIKVSNLLDTLTRHMAADNRNSL